MVSPRIPFTAAIRGKHAGQIKDRRTPRQSPPPQGVADHRGGGAKYTWGSHLPECFTPTRCGRPPGGGKLGTRGGHTSQTVSPPQGVADHRGGGGLGTRGGHTSQSVSTQGVADHPGGELSTRGGHTSQSVSTQGVADHPATGGGGGLGTRGGHTSQTVSPPQGVADHRGGGGGLGTRGGHTSQTVSPPQGVANHRGG